MRSRESVSGKVNCTAMYLCLVSEYTLQLVSSVILSDLGTKQCLLTKINSLYNTLRNTVLGVCIEQIQF